MHLTRERKEELVADLAAKIDDHPVVGLLDMHSLPARQLQEIKKELVDDVEIRMTRKTLIRRALDDAETDGITELDIDSAVQPALLFTDTNPFSLFKLIQEKKTSAAASGGEIAPTDIEIPEGPTDLDPGPMLGKIQEFGAPTSVEDGKITVDSAAVAVEAGEEITPELAEVLNALGIEPLEVGLDLKLVFEDGEIFGRDVLEIDVDDYRADIESGAARAFNLAVNAGVMNDATAEPVVQQAVRQARNLAVNAGIVDEEVIEDLVRKAAAQAAAVDTDLDLASVEPDEGDDGAEDEEDATADEEDTETDESGDDDQESAEDASDETPEDEEDTEVN